MGRSRVERILESLAPARVLDVGCGCGRFSSELAKGGRQVIAVDPVFGGRVWHEAEVASGVHFCCMDGSALGFGDGSFPLVLEREALHHIVSWPDVVAEMMRVTSGHVVLVEPVDDLRSAAKRRTFEAQVLLLEVQAEAGCAHYLHLDSESLVRSLQDLGSVVEVHVDRSDAAISFDEFFVDFGELAGRTRRPAYWQERLRDLRARIGVDALCEDDTLTVLAMKHEP
jgi:SAM-dependent methyltransferase